MDIAEKSIGAVARTAAAIGLDIPPSLANRDSFGVPAQSAARLRRLTRRDIYAVASFHISLPQADRRRRFGGILGDDAVLQHYLAQSDQDVEMFGHFGRGLNAVAELYAVDVAWRRVEVVLSASRPADCVALSELGQLVVLELVTRGT